MRFQLMRAITGSGLLVHSGTGTTTLTNVANAGTWATSVSNGTLQLGTGTTIGTGALTMTGGVLDLNGNSASTSALSGTGGTIDTTSVGGVSTLTINQNGVANPNLTYSGSIANTSGTLSVVKAGGGNLNLAGTGTYDGNTTITGGSLTITSSNALKAGTTLDTQVINGLFFGGNITVASNVQLSAPAAPVRNCLMSTQASTPPSPAISPILQEARVLRAVLMPETIQRPLR